MIQGLASAAVGMPPAIANIRHRGALLSPARGRAGFGLALDLCRCVSGDCFLLGGRCSPGSFAVVGDLGVLTHA